LFGLAKTNKTDNRNYYYNYYTSSSSDTIRGGVRGPRISIDARGQHQAREQSIHCQQTLNISLCLSLSLSLSFSLSLATRRSLEATLLPHVNYCWKPATATFRPCKNRDRGSRPWANAFLYYLKYNCKLERTTATTTPLFDPPDSCPWETRWPPREPPFFRARVGNSYSAGSSSANNSASARSDGSNNDNDSREGYKFGHVTRGLIESIREKRQQRLLGAQQQQQRNHLYENISDK